MRNRDITENPQDPKTAMGASALTKAVGATVGGQQVAKALDTLGSGKAISGPLAKALDPYADVLHDVISDPKYRSMFLRMVSAIKADKAKKQAAEPMQAAQPKQAPAPKAPVAPASAPMDEAEEDATGDVVDTVTLDVPLMIRLLEYAREDAKDDMDLHDVAEKLISLSKNNDPLTMDHYDAIVGADENLPVPADEPVNENYGYGYDSPVDASDENINYSQTKRIGDSTVTISANAKSMDELHTILKLAGLDPKVSNDAAEEVPAEEVPSDVAIPGTIETPGDCADVEVQAVSPMALPKKPLDLRYTTDKTSLLNAIKDKLAQRLS